MTKHIKFYKGRFIQKCGSIRHLKSSCEIWEELEKVRFKYKHRKLNDKFWYIIPWGEGENLRCKIHEVTESTQKGRVINQGGEDQKYPN